MLSTIIRRIVCAGFAWAFSVGCFNAIAQLANITDVTQVPKPGTPHDYLKDLNDIVNPANGSVSIHILADTPSERGAVQRPQYAYIYNTSGPYSLSAQFAIILGYSQPFIASVIGTNQSIGVSPIANNWTHSSVLFTYVVDATTGTTGTCQYNNNYVYYDKNGERHPLGLTYVYPGEYTTDCSLYYQGQGPQTHLTGGDLQYKARLSSSGNIVAIWDRHGNEMVKSEDTNGNIDNGYVRGSGRQYTSTGGGGGDYSAASLTIPGLGASYTATTYPSSNGSSFTLNMNLLPSYQGAYCQNNYVGTGTTLSLSVPEVTNGMQTMTLPNKQTYGFQYEPVYGMISQITYPTGARVKYTWGLNTQSEGIVLGSPSNYQIGAGMCGYIYDWMAVSSRIVSYDGVNDAQEQDFSYSTCWTAGSCSVSNSIFWSSKTTTVWTTDLTKVGHPKFKTVYTYLPGYDYTQPFSPTNAQQSSPIPIENTIAYYDTSGTLLKTVTKTWYPNTQDLMSGECITVPNVGTSGTFYQYESGGPGGIYAEAGLTDLVTDKAEYDYGLTTCARPSTTPSRETITAYQSFTPAPTSLNPIDRTIYDRPQSVKVYDKGALIAETDYGYDGAGIRGYAVSAVSPQLYAHDASFAWNASPAAPRGNLTSVTKKCFQADCQNITTTVTYDEGGQVTSVTDGRGNTTLLSHADVYTTDDGAPPSGYSTDTYVTQITRPQTGAVAHVSNFQWDYNKGELRSASDENNQPSTYRYDDPWARLTQSNFPDGGQTSVWYNDTAAMTTPYDPIVKTTTLLNGGPSEVHESEADPMGRVIHSYLTSDPLGTVTTDTTYDGLSRVFTVSNPYRSQSEVTYGLTTYGYDALGRKTSQLDSDNISTKQWCYDNLQTAGQTNCHAHVVNSTGEWVDSVDENGNDWQRTTDALGRMTSVVEPNGLTHLPTMVTAYRYNALDDLRGVEQCGGPCTSSGSVLRSYIYDSLSQLAASSNPETGTVQYTYDGNGNLHTKSDARSVTTTYAYDALNRILSKTYANDASGTPSSCYQYDLSPLTGGGSTPYWTGRLTNQWTQNGSCATTLPSSGFWTRRSILAYDSMGRIKSEQQCTPSNCSGTPYAPAYSYDLAGNLLTFTDGVTPSPTAGTTLSFTNCYDAAGRLQALTSNWIDTKHPQSLFLAQSTSSNPCPNATSPTSSSTPYAAFGGLMNATFGNSLTLSRAYDNRLRITSEMDLGSVLNPGTSGSTTVTITGAEQSK